MLSRLVYTAAHPKIAMQVTTSDQLSPLDAALTTARLSTMRLRVRVGHAEIVTCFLDVRCPSRSSDVSTRYVICTPEQSTRPWPSECLLPFDAMPSGCCKIFVFWIDQAEHETGTSCHQCRCKFCQCAFSHSGSAAISANGYHR